jgi:sugar lactone lactonase YvrE
MYRSASSPRRGTAGRVIRGFAAGALCVSGAVIAGVAATAAPAGAANPSPQLYEVDFGNSTINVFPTTAVGDVPPSVSVTANSGSLNAPQGAAFDAQGDLWVANSTGQTIAEYTPQQLASTGSPTPNVVLSVPAIPTAVTFDASGNLWTTFQNQGIAAFSPDQLLMSAANPEPRLLLTGAGNGTFGLTFDAAGNLWAATFSGVNTQFDNSLVEFTRADLAFPSGSNPTVTTPPAVTISGLNGPENPTFDAHGDLWFSAYGDGAVQKFIPSQLTASGSPSPNVDITSPAFIHPAGLSFDTTGDLWVSDLNATGVFQFTPAQLTSSGSPTPTQAIQGISNTTFHNPTDVLVTQPPVVSSVTPTSGGGGTTVTISGAGFNSGSSVSFGNNAATSVTDISAYQLQAVAPPGSGTVNVSVSTFAGTTAAGQFTYPATPTPPTPPSTPATTNGYWLVGSDGGIFSFGAAQFYGSTGSLHLQRPVVGIVPTADHGGYWLNASDGGVFSYGDTQFYGSIPGLGLHPAGSGQAHSLNAPIVGMVPSIDDNGYFMVASDGGVFAFGDAHFAGSCPGIGGCSGAAVAVMPDASGNGYWLVTATGNVYTFGDAAYFGAPGHGTVTSAVATPDGKGYWILLSNGQVLNYGDAANLGSPDSSNFNSLDTAASIFATSDGGGYWVSSALGAVFNFGDAPNNGGMTGTHLNGSIIAGAGF